MTLHRFHADTRAISASARWPVLGLAALAVLVTIGVAVHAADVPLIPREVIFGNPERVGPQLSPDGKLMAYVAPEGGVLNVWVRTVGKEDDRAITHDRGRGIMGYFWAPNGQQILYVQDKDGDENWRVFAVPAAGGEAIDLTPLSGVQAQIVAVELSHPDEILVSLNDRDPRWHDVYRVDLRNGQRTLEVRNDISAAGWLADHDLRIRLARVPRPDGGFTLKERVGSEWKVLLEWGSDDALTTGPVEFSKDGKTLYLISSVGANAAQLRAMDLAAGSEIVLASDPAYDVSGATVHPTTYEIQAVSFTKDRTEWKVLDPSLQPDIDALGKLNPGDFYIVDRDRADRTWLIAYTQDRGPVVYYSYDRASRKGTFLFSARPALEKCILAEMKPVTFKARDGLTIHGLLTLPVGIQPKNLPVVLNVHGGPWARDTWGYDPEAQWLANRGYACLQVNFRGSTGYGKEFINAGDREWGGKMQDDLSDGVHWLIAQGTADPKRVAIYGGSYGGYATLVGMTMTPELYACGISMVGPSNLVSFINTIPPYWESMKSVFDKRLGNPEKDAEFLKSRSPLFYIDQVRAPLFIAQGANDPRVNREESIQIRDALQKAGKAVEYLEFDNEGHGFARPENRLKFYAQSEAFLAKHLGGRAEL